MVLCLQRLYPALVAGKDYRCLIHLDANGNRTGNPEIAFWRSTAVQQPPNEAVLAFFKSNEALIRADYIRQFRDMELAATDGLANTPSDAPPDVQARADAWKAYRQALRDITTQPSFPMNITVPQRPDNQ
ncbi:phage tail assembly chaperone [Burkholderia vietnamiensis]|uniref:XkdW family protein n=1 Tax=Burkholderia vietnamiensis TaxID=60552 RepID=UPI003B973423